MSNGSTKADKALAEPGTDRGELAGDSSAVPTDAGAEELKKHTHTHKQTA